jgi:hypothetical protein
MAWDTGPDVLWTVVNERDELGSDLVPDYLTSVQDGAFYGWPYSYYGRHLDTRVSQPPARAGGDRAGARLRARPAHGVARAGAFHGGTLPPAFADGMFIGQHGSWNRRPHSGYKVIFVPFQNGRPKRARHVDVLSGFLSEAGDAMGPAGGRGRRRARRLAGGRRRRQRDLAGEREALRVAAQPVQGLVMACRSSSAASTNMVAPISPSSTRQACGRANNGASQRAP